MTTMSRREFAGSGAACVFAAAGGPLARWSAAAPPSAKVLGLQLFTVQAELGKDFNSTLRKVAAIGYKQVEAAGFYEKSAVDFRKAIESVGLVLPSCHYSMQELLTNTNAKLDFAHQLGVRYVVCSFPFVANPGRFHADKYYQELRIGMTLNDWKWNFDRLNQIGERVRQAGLQLAYHNHNHEFREMAGVLVYDELLRATDPTLVKMEMDVGWVACAGHDPVAFLEKYADRVELLHVKDIKPGPPDLSGDGTPSTELGRGVIDWKRLFDAARRAEVKHYFVEQEEPFVDMSALDAIKADFEFASRF
jgi:sugar phosphate isomerase/epimerase